MDAPVPAAGEPLLQSGFLLVVASLFSFPPVKAMGAMPKHPLIVLFAALCIILAGGCRSTKLGEDFTPYLVRVYVEESANLPASHLLDLTLPVSGSQITVRSKPVFAEWDLLHAASFDTELGPAIVLLFTPTAAGDFYRTTITNQGRRLVFTINGLPVGARMIEGPVQDGRIAFFPEIDEEDVPALASGIQKTSAKIQERLKQQGKW